jgi:hypothetical protein
MYLPNPKSKLRSFLFFSTFPYWIKEKSVATLANRDIAIKTTKKSSSPYDRTGDSAGDPKYLKREVTLKTRSLIQFV